jgi:hypothetical protein
VRYTNEVIVKDPAFQLIDAFESVTVLRRQES